MFQANPKKGNYNNAIYCYSFLFGFHLKRTVYSPVNYVNVEFISSNRLSIIFTNLEVLSNIIDFNAFIHF